VSVVGVERGEIFLEEFEDTRGVLKATTGYKRERAGISASVHVCMDGVLTPTQSEVTV